MRARGLNVLKKSGRYKAGSTAIRLFNPLYALVAVMDEWLEAFTFAVLVKKVNGGTCTIQARLTDTGRELKQKISAKTGVPADEMWVTYRGRPVDGEKTLEEQDFQQNCTVDELLRMRGGAARATA
jgi:hypothetical protein